MKTLLKDQKDFRGWLENTQLYFLAYPICGNPEPTEYPCVVVEDTVDNYYGDKDFSYYEFVYLKDFK